MLAKYFGARKTGSLRFKEIIVGCRDSSRSDRFDYARTGCRTGDNLFSDSRRDFVSFGG